MPVQPNLHMFSKPSPAESPVHNQIDDGLIKPTSVLSQCSFLCVTLLAPWNRVMKWLLVWQNSCSQSDQG